MNAIAGQSGSTRRINGCERGESPSGGHRCSSLEELPAASPSPDPEPKGTVEEKRYLGRLGLRWCRCGHLLQAGLSDGVEPSAAPASRQAQQGVRGRRLLRRSSAAVLVTTRRFGVLLDSGASNGRGRSPPPEHVDPPHVDCHEASSVAQRQGTRLLRASRLNLASRAELVQPNIVVSRRSGGNIEAKSRRCWKLAIGR